MKRTEQALLDFVDTASIGLHWVAADGTILWANPADHEPLGYSAEEYIGQNISQFHADEHVITDILNRLTAGQRLNDYSARLRCKDGSMREVLITSSVRFDETGKFLHTRCFTVDVSRRRPQGTEIQIEALSREVERLRILASRERGLTDAILNSSPHGVIVCDLNGKLTLQNAAVEQIWAGSASAESIAGWGKYRAFHSDGRPFEPEDWSMARALKSAEVCAAEEVRIQRFDDSYGVLVGSAAPIFGADGQLEGALSIFTDITRLKQQEEEIRVGAQRFFTTLQSIGDAVVATDAQGRIEYLNPIAQQLTRCTLEEARGRPLDEIFHFMDEQTRRAVESPFARVLREGKVTSLAHNTLLVARDGFEVSIDDCVSPIFDSKGELAGAVLVFRDATEKRREEGRRRFLVDASATLSSSLDYVSTLKRVVELSVPTVADWCVADMVEADGAVDRLATAHVSPAKFQCVKELQCYLPNPRSAFGTHEVIRTGRSQLRSEIADSLLEEIAVDAQHLRLLRELGFRSAMVVPLRARGQTLGALMFVSAESTRKFGDADLAFAEELANIAALAIENARLYREAQNANRTKDEFLATVSHELRTPLNAILGWASLLRTSETSSEKRERALEVIERNARAQAQLIEDLLDVSRIISGTLRLDSRPVDLATIIEAALDALRLAADSKGVRIRTALDDDARPAMGDSSRLQQIVWNLLSNAVKFTDRGGLVSVSLTRINSQAEINVSDTGRGIAPDFLPHIFERFKQADAATTRSHGGLGLGLAIVKHLVELHGGAVTAMSDGKGQGSMFRVRLPLAAVMRDEVPALGPSAASRIVAPRLDGLRVLVVDDELDARALLTAVLEAHGAQVESAASVREALAQIERCRPDVLVSDIGMPEEDGYSLIRKVRAMTKNQPKAIPAAALTAYARMEDRARAMLAGFQSHIAKPIDPDELLIVVATLAGRTSD